jgi:hypothetical protein
METMTLADFIAEHGLTMTVAMTDSNPHMSAWSRRAWLCTIASREGETMSLHFSQGPAHTSEPDLATVLDCVAGDIASVRNAPDWLDWAEEMGAEMEGDALRRLRASHEAITLQAGELEALIGYDALETLLWATARL